MDLNYFVLSYVCVARMRIMSTRMQTWKLNVWGYFSAVVSVLPRVNIEQPLCQIADDACRSSGEVAGHVEFAGGEFTIQAPSYGYADECSRNDAAVSGSRLVVIDQSPFYRWQVPSAAGGSALVFTTDGQLGTSAVCTCYLHRLNVSRGAVPVSSTLHAICFSRRLRISGVLRPHDPENHSAVGYDAVMLKVQELQPLLQPTQVIADFEEAPANAVRNVFGSNLLVSGCWLHYAQALSHQAPT